MNTQRLGGFWSGAKGKLRQRFPELTEEDLVWQPGEEERLLEHLQRRTGQTREQLEFFLEVECGCCEPAGAAARSGPIRWRGETNPEPGFTPASAWPSAFDLRRDRESV